MAPLMASDSVERYCIVVAALSLACFVFDMRRPAATIGALDFGMAIGLHCYFATHWNEMNFVSELFL